jgi:hypothetical protein
MGVKLVREEPLNSMEAVAAVTVEKVEYPGKQVGTPDVCRAACPLCRGGKPFMCRCSQDE